ncbi:MAG: type II secretion system protein, partial [Planctomycetes bacterium]|nr:type II secretion system protein [Planctomycetota bacterium]
MADPRRTEAGFTLAEMLAALGILLFGVTSLLAAMASSIGQRRSADARLETTALVEHVVHRAMHECVALRDGSSSPVDLEFRPL